MIGRLDMAERSLYYAIGASLLAHALALALGNGAGRLPEVAPHLLEARLVADTPPEPPKPQMLPQARPQPVKPEVHHPQPVQPQPVAKARPEAPAAAQPQAVLTAAATSSSPNTPAVPAGVPGGVPMAPPAPAPVAQAAPAAPAYVPPSAGLAYLNNPKPSYPLLARRRGLEGVVQLEVRVAADGHPLSAQIRNSSGHEILDEAARNAVLGWRFSPAKRGGEPVEGVALVPIRFQLGSEGG